MNNFTVAAAPVVPSKRGMSFGLLDTAVSPSVSEIPKPNLKRTPKKSPLANKRIKPSNCYDDSVLNEFKCEENGTSEIFSGIFSETWNETTFQEPQIDMEVEEEMEEKAYYFERPEGTYVVLKQGETLNFHGLFTIKIVHGNVDVLGYKLSKNDKFPLYSPRGTSLLYIRNINTSPDLPNLNLMKKYPEKCSIFLVLRLQDYRMLFVEKHISQIIFPTMESANKPRVEFEPSGFNLLQTDPAWDGIIDKISTTSRVFICGGKGVGKSTCLRYFINKLLPTFQRINVIDLDPGQAEFTVPGCLSYVQVKKPLFGPNYTHLKTGTKSFLCDINPGNDPKKYLHIVDHLINSSDLSDYPTLINYMGFTHGLGLNIVSSVIVSVKPTDVVQIDSFAPKRNFMCNITPNVVEENARLLTPDIETEVHFNLIKINSKNDGIQGWSLGARQGREMCILAYLHGIIKSDSIFNSEQPLYFNKLSNLNIANLYGQTIHPAVINANYVALCTQVDKVEPIIFNALGWGIVRGIDVKEDKIVMLSSVRLEMMKNVTDLVYCEILLPPSLYMTPDGVVGEMPYVVEGALMDFGQITKRSRVPANKIAQ